MVRDYQPSFTGGEIAPGLWARTDLARYQVALALCKNWIIHGHGGVSNRAGSSFVLDTGAALQCLIPFEFNTEQTYILVFTHNRMRVIKDGSMVLNANKAITAISSMGQVTSAAHGYVDGDIVFITGSDTKLDDRFLTISGVTTDTFETGIITSDSATGSVASVYTLTTPYSASEMFEASFTQSNDVMTITHEDFSPRNITRTGHNAWTIEVIDYQSDLVPPANLNGWPVGYNPLSVGKDYNYVVTSANDDGDESVASAAISVYSYPALDDTRGIQLVWDSVAGATYYNVYKENAKDSGTFGFIGEADARPDTSIAITLITDASVAAITTASNHGLETGDQVYLEGITGEAAYTALNARFFVVTVIDGDTFTIPQSTASATGNNVSGSGVARSRNGFTDFNLGPDVGVTPPLANNPFDAAGKYPAAVAYYQQRQAFAGGRDTPQAIKLTRTSDYNNMDYSRPRKADDSIEVTLANQQVNKIRYLLAMDGLLAFSTGGTWLITPSDDSGVLKPSNTMPVRQNPHGCAKVRPLEVSGTALFVQKQGSRIRSTQFRLEQNKQVSSDMSIMAEHLFEGHSIKSWCYAEEPYGMVWAVREDGALLSLTFLPDQEVWGWAQHETDGKYISVASITEGNEDVVYACIRRKINGSWRYYTERFSTRKFSDLRDCFFVDSGLTRTGTSKAIDEVTKDSGKCMIRVTAHGLVDGDYVWVRDAGGMTQINDRQYIVDVLNADTAYLKDENGNYIDPTDYDVYTDGGIIECCLPATVSNLHHLEGKTLVALSDGNVISDLLVTNGLVALPRPAYKLHIGLPYNCDIQTLPIDLQGNVLAASKKAIGRASVRIEATRGLSVGQEPGKLYEMKQRTARDDYRAMGVADGMIDVEVAIPWTNDGQVWIRQANPLPAKILSIVPEVTTRP